MSNKDSSLKLQNNIIDNINDISHIEMQIVCNMIHSFLLILLIVHICKEEL